MTISFTVEAGGVPAGPYQAEFILAEPFQGREEYGPALKLCWKILAGEHRDTKVDRLVSAKLKQGSHLYNFLVALHGGPLPVGQSVNLQTYYGTRGVIVVDAPEGSFSKVVSFVKQS